MCAAAGEVPEIPIRRSRHVQKGVSRPHAIRSRNEHFIRGLKNSRPVATRHDQIADGFLGFSALS